jgi:hypothetical protein
MRGAVAHAPAPHSPGVESAAMLAPGDGGAREIGAWLERNVGKVLAIHRQPRWRPVWFADVERDGQRLELCVRGDRTDMPLVFPLDHEMRLQSVLHDHGIPTARVWGLI